MKDQAVRIHFNFSIGEYFGFSKEFLDLSGHFQNIGKNFSSTDSLFEAGNEKHGLELAHRFSENDKLRFIYTDDMMKGAASNQVSQNSLTARRVQNLTTRWSHVWKKFTFLTEYLVNQKKNSLSDVYDKGKTKDTDNIVGERVQYDFSKETSLFAGLQLSFDDSKSNLTSAGISQKLTEDITAHLQASAGERRDSVLAGLERQMDKDTSVYANYAVNNSPIDGQASTTTFGSNTKISSTAKLRRERQLVTSDMRGAYTSSLMGLENQLNPHLAVDASYERREETLDAALKGSEPRDAVSTNIAYIDPDHYKGSSKFEYRIDTGDQWQILSDSQGEIKMNRDYSVFGEYEYSLGQDQTREIAISRIDKKQIGLAYRPVDFDWLNLLFKYIRLQDDRPRDLTSADGGFLKQKSTYDEYAGEFALDLPWRFQVRAMLPSAWLFHGTAWFHHSRSPVIQSPR